MFFVHPQIQFNISNLKKVITSFFKKPDFDLIEKRLASFFPDKKIIFTDMGRSAFKIIIEKMNLKNCEVILPAYICDIFYPILKHYNIKPIFLDINLETFSLDQEHILNAITPQTKAVLIPHTYGLPVNVSRIENIQIIEDCAHYFNLSHKSSNILFFSLYKQFPSVRGGMLVCPKEWNIELKKTKFSFRDFVSLLNCFPFFAFIFKKLPGDKLKQEFIRKEKMLEPASINSVSLNLFFNFLNDYNNSFEKRKELALYFQQELKVLGFEIQKSEDNIFCYISALIPKNLEQKRDKLVNKLKKEKIFCTRMWHNPIIFNKHVQKEYGVNVIDFPNTVKASRRILNFPLQNHYNEKDVLFIIKKIKKTIENL